MLPSTSRSVRDLQSSTLLTIAKSRNISSEILFWSKIKLFQKFERERLFLWKALNLRHNKIWLDHVSNLCCTNTNLDLLICKKKLIWYKEFWKKEWKINSTLLWLTDKIKGKTDVMFFWFGQWWNLLFNFLLIMLIAILIYLHGGWDKYLQTHTIQRLNCVGNKMLVIEAKKNKIRLSLWRDILDV